MSGTSLHAALTGLVDVFTAAGQGLQVADGPNQEPELLCLEVGWAGDGIQAVTGPRTGTDFGLSQSLEVFDIHCLLSNHDGTSTIPAARAVLAATFDLLDGSLRANPQLSGAVMSASIVEVGYWPNREIEHTGVTVSMSFVVRVRSAA